jgi:hypothetical protein
MKQALWILLAMIALLVVALLLTMHQLSTLRQIESGSYVTIGDCEEWCNSETQLRVGGVPLVNDSFINLANLTT